MTIRFPAPVLSQARVHDLEECLQKEIVATWWEPEPWEDEAGRKAVSFVIGVLLYPRDVSTRLTGKDGSLMHFRPMEESEVDQLRALGLVFHSVVWEYWPDQYPQQVAYLDENPMLQEAEAEAPAVS